ncbi:MAG TPA: SPOR domain-containing protein [Blastocatellia bacterium]|nr:SPOR domain-containing protein [Blastocatellia bacterium]
MQSKLAIFSATILLSLISLAQAQTNENAPCFTLQVASFPDTALAEDFAAKLARAGESTGWGTVELPGRGHWTRVFVGSFKTIGAARGYGEALVARGLIAEYLVKTAYDVKSLSRPRTVGISTGGNPMTEKKRAVLNPTMKASQAQPFVVSSHNVETIKAVRTFLPTDLRDYSSATLPVARKVKLSLAPSIDTASIPRPDPVRLAFNFIVGTTAQRGGLWLTGDKKEGLERLQWIVGSENVDLISLDENGRVKLNKKLLAQAAGAGETNSLEAPLIVADYINSNEGLLLLAQLTQGAHRYCLHIGHQAQTASGLIEVTGSINLDNNYDSRINPYRRGGKKLGNERPPEGFDSLIAINPVARWFNLRTNSLVPVAHITFHELSEAHAKLDMRLDYLEHGSQAGAHNVAIAREERLKLQRPLSDVILTLGSNRVLRSEEEIRQFYSQASHTGGSKR